MLFYLSYLFLRHESYVSYLSSYTSSSPRIRRVIIFASCAAQIATLGAISHFHTLVPSHGLRTGKSSSLTSVCESYYCFRILPYRATVLRCSSIPFTSIAFASGLSNASHTIRSSQNNFVRFSSVTFMQSVSISRYGLIFNNNDFSASVLYIPICSIKYCCRFRFVISTTSNQSDVDGRLRFLQVHMPRLTQSAKPGDRNPPR